MPQDTAPTQSRPLGVAFAACGASSLLLLANHPKNAAHDFAGVLREETANRVIDGIVHGGFILVLAALVVCCVLLARRLGAGRPAVVTCVVSFCIGSAALMASMLVDGLVVPAIAARYVGIEAPEQLAAAKGLFVFAGTLISFLMPLGVAFQSFAMLTLGGLLVASEPRRRAAGAFGVTAGLLILVLLAAAPAQFAAHVLLGAIALLGLWYLTLAWLLFRGRLAA